MLEKELIYYCAPTLAGMKTANLFSHKFQEKDKFLKDIFALNNTANDKGVQIDILSIKKNRALIYVYREKSLLKDLKSSKASKILNSYGYDVNGTVEDYIENLKLRLEMTICFPHEIGLFLGYPAEDVAEFIRQQGKNCKFCGLWKVYCNVDDAKALCAKYEHCQTVYRRVFNKVGNIAQMIVSA